MPQTKSAPQTLREHAQSKRVSRFHKSHFVRKFTGKMPRPRVSDQAPAFTPNVRTPQCGNTVWGKNHLYVMYALIRISSQISTFKT